MDIGSILLGLALLLVVVFIVAQPLLDRAGAAERAPGPLDALLAEHERVLLALRDLDFDHAMGKTLADDYVAQREQLLAQGRAVLQQLDSLAPGQASGVDLDDQIEQAIARRRRRGVSAVTRGAAEADSAVGSGQRRTAAPPTGRFCSQCGRPARPEDKFCGACGAALPALAESGTAKAKR